jgi:hypothetical protein
LGTLSNFPTWNNFQVSGNPCIKNVISTAHGTLAWSVSCRYSNPIISVNAVLSREWYFSVDLFILANLLAYSFCVVPPPHKLMQVSSEGRGNLSFYFF